MVAASPIRPEPCTLGAPPWGQVLGRATGGISKSCMWLLLSHRVSSTFRDMNKGGEEHGLESVGIF